jgi:TolB-like protein/Tfp pilus assembly protein PilF
VYLGRDIRTVQLWEKKEGLPVHRHTHKARASVYAYASEIDTWRKNRRVPVATDVNSPASSAAVPAQAAVPPPARRRLPAYVFAGILVFLALVIGGVVRWRLVSRAGIFPDPPATLAVLPFEDLSPGPLEGYLADGLTDDLITNLGRSGQLQLISRTSVARFKDTHESLPQIARALHANLVLEGTVMYSGKRARITAQLIDARNDQHLWANSYERDFDNVLSLQDEVAADVARAVLEKLTSRTVTETPAARSVDPDVRTNYLRGRFFWNKRDEAGLKQAMVHFNQAIAKDPSYAPAYVGLADCYNLLSVWGSLAAQEAFPQAKEAAQKALKLDPASAEAYTSLAFETYRFEWNFADAEKYFQKAILLNPNYATAHQWYGEFLGDLRRFAHSIAESEKAEQLDPLSTIVGSDLADSYLHASRYKDAINELNKILLMDSGFVPAHRYLSEAYSLSGQTAKAIEERDQYIRLSGDMGAFQVVRIGEEFASGKQTEARKHAEALLRNPGKGRFDYFHMAQMYVSLGDRDKAFDCLERAYQEHSWWLVTLLVDPGLAPLRNDQRLQSLARRVGLPLAEDKKDL